MPIRSIVFLSVLAGSVAPAGAAQLTWSLSATLDADGIHRRG